MLRNPSPVTKQHQLSFRAGNNGKDKPFLYFCMQQDSQWVFQGNDKRPGDLRKVCDGFAPAWPLMKSTPLN